MPGATENRKPKTPQHPAEHHPHLHQRQVLTCAYRRSVREWEECTRVVLSFRSILAEPPFWKESLWRVEVTFVPMDAEGMKVELCTFGDDSTRCTTDDQRCGGASTYSFPSTFAPLPLSTDRCDPLGTDGRRRSASFLFETVRTSQCELLGVVTHMQPFKYSI